MRVGLVCPYSLTIPGGVQGQVLGLARALRTLGHEVRVLGPCDGPPPDAGVTPLGHSVPTAANGSVAPLAPDPSAQLRTIRALRDEDFDVVHLHEPIAPGPTMTALLFGDAPMVGTFHAAGVSAAYRYLGWALKRLAARLDHRCAVSPDAQRLAQTYLGGRYQLLFNGIEVERFANGPAHPTEAPTIFFLGRHEPRKGLEVLLEAMGELPQNVRLWVGGDGPQTAELQARHACDPRIEWLGRVSDDERGARMRGCTVYCSPSVRGESFGMVLLEAMASGGALVASDLDGHRNVATDGVDALLTPVGDAAALAKALGRVLDDDGLRRELVVGGRKRADELSMTHLAERYVEIYTALLAGHPARG
ncbi:MAG TPA: glycosyltransferase family 4 protein [Acidimicrobiales bacterium]|nr:glycosyltransferase family 4 protein [Acidimicrobiales bacterium]